jgi:dipeptidyl-peptidase 4
VTSFPRQHARTRRFTLGVPRSVTVAPDEPRLLFLRSATGEDPITSLWELDLAAADPVERCVVDVRDLDDEDPAALPPEERARRERAREMAGGITSYATDRDLGLAAFTLGGRLHTVDVGTGRVVEHPAAPAFDPRPSPDGTKVVYVSGDGLHLLDLVSGPRQPGVTRPLVIESGISWGRAEFVAAEEMGRSRGVWWSPEGDRIAACRVDESAVPTWHIADPANPDRAPQVSPYPAAGTTNADVRLAVLSIEGGRRVDVNWDRETFPYLARVRWEERLTLQVQTRDQRRVQVLLADPETGATEVVREWSDERWVELVPGTPAWAGDRLVTVADLDDHGPAGSRALLIDGEVVTGPAIQVRSVVGATSEQVVFTASDEDPTQVHVWAWRPDGGLQQLSDATVGVHGAAGAGTTQVLTTSTLEAPVPRVVARWSGPEGVVEHGLAVHAAEPLVEPRVRLLELGPRRLRAALLLPPATTTAARFRCCSTPTAAPTRSASCGPGTPSSRPSGSRTRVSRCSSSTGVGPRGGGRAGSGRSTSTWRRRCWRTRSTPCTRLPTSNRGSTCDRVAIRGWSFGGYLAALAVLRRPDVFHAAVAGAPVTDWALYDTHYTERYLGHPEQEAKAYEVSSLVDADGRLLGAGSWDGTAVPELLLVHGLADDNVVAAHALYGSRARSSPTAGRTGSCPSPASRT